MLVEGLRFGNELPLMAKRVRARLPFLTPFLPRCGRRL